MKKYLFRFFFVVLCITSLCLSAFAVDNSVHVDFEIKNVMGNTSSKSLSIGPSSTSTEISAVRYDTITYKSAVVYSELGTTTFQISPVSSDFSASTSTTGANCSYSISGDTATIVVNRTASSSSEIVDVVFSGQYKVSKVTEKVSASGYSFTSAGSEPDPPANPPFHTMQGLQNGQRYAIYSTHKWETFNQYVGFYNTIATGKFTLSDGSTSDVERDIGWIAIDSLAALGFNAYSWKIDEQTKALKFSSGAFSSSWLDMIWKYQTYNFYWGLQLMTGQTDGNSWFDRVTTDFAYLNYRVNQLFEVLSNDEDLDIKNTTTPERDWVKGYFSGSGDKADSDKYNSINSDGQALKNFLTPSESASMSDALSAVESQGYSFWSENVYQDINQVSSTATTDLGDEVPWEEQINDLYSEHVASIWGAFDG